MILNPQAYPSEQVVLITPGGTGRRFVLWFGAYGCTKLMVHARHLEDALDECVDWLAEHKPGLLADQAVAEAYHDALARGLSEEDAQEEATVDTTCAGNYGNYLNSWEWGIVCDDHASRADIKRILGGQS